jgi:site-specific DNA-cytosine methylase
LPSGWENPNVIWASPPCTTFSVLTLRKHWKDGECISSKGLIGCALACKAVEIIKELKPKYYFIENPRGMLRTQYFMHDIPRYSVTYCQYGKNYQKPTDIWSNADLNLKYCNPGDKCHVAQPRDKSKRIFGGVQDLKDAYERGIIPELLCEEIYKSCLIEPKQIKLIKYLEGY